MLACNLGKGDRTVRIIFGIGLIVGGFFTGGIPGVIVGIVGLIPLITGLVEILARIKSRPMKMLWMIM